MKQIKKYIVALILGSAAMTGCTDEPELKVTDKGPEMTISSIDTSALMGGTVDFAITLKDPIALSTLKAELLFDEDVVGNITIRTKENGTYEANIPVPYYKNIPDGNALMRFTGQNIEFGTTVVEQQVAISRPDFESITFVTGGEEYKMNRTAKYQYEVTGDFPPQADGYIVTPDIEGEGTAITFGWEGGAVEAGTRTNIPFSDTTGAAYTIKFNIQTYEASPFAKITVNGEQMSMEDASHFSRIMTINTGDTLTFEGVRGYEDFWVDVDYYEQQADGSLKFTAMSGTYKITANMDRKWIETRVYSGGAPATLQSDGTGTVWILGDGFGKPSLSYQPGWNPGAGICFAPVDNGIYQITAVGGLTLNATDINFKFFHQDGWGGEYSSTKLTCNSDIVFVGDGNGATDTKPARDNGNIGIYKGKSFEVGSVYVFTLDVTAGIDNAVLTVTKAGEVEIPSEDITFAGVKMEQLDASNYAAVVSLKKGTAYSFTGISNPAEWYFDDNYFAATADGKLSSLVVDGYYKVKANTDSQLLTISPCNEDGSDVTMKADGTGVCWLMAWGVGFPSQDFQFGWDPGKAYAMAEVEPGVYKLTGKAGPEKGSSPGDYFRYDYISAKYFHQNGWGGEMADPVVVGGLLKAGGNLELSDGNLEEGATYELTIDLTTAEFIDGNSVGATVTFIKK